MYFFPVPDEGMRWQMDLDRMNPNLVCGHARVLPHVRQTDRHTWQRHQELRPQTLTSKRGCTAVQKALAARKENREENTTRSNSKKCEEEI